MGASQAPSASGTEAQGSSPVAPHGWPHSVVCWLFGLGEEHHQPTSPPIPVAAISEHLHQSRGRGRRRRPGAHGR